VKTPKVTRRGRFLGARFGLLLGLNLLALPAGAERILVAIDEAYPPHQFRDAHGQPAGFDVDLLRAVAEREGLELELSLAPWADILRRLEAGEIDVNPGVFRTPVREQLLDFTLPTAPAHYAIFVQTDSSIDGLEDLEGKRVLVREGAYHAERVATHGIPVETVTAATPEECIQRLAAGEADAAVVLNTQGLYLIRENGIRNLRTLTESPGELELRFAVPDDREELLLKLNDGLNRVHKDGTYDALYDEWFGVLQPRGVPVARVLWLLGAGLLVLAAVGAGSVAWSRTLRHRVERRTRELLETDARLQTTLAAMRDLGFVVASAPGDDGRILEFSEGAQRLFGYGRDEAVGQAASVLRTAADAERHGSSLGEIGPEGHYSREVELVRKTGEAFTAFVVSSRLPEDETGSDRMLYVFIDLTERIRAEQAQRALRERVHRSETMQALGRLAGGIAHDFNNVLTSILGNAHLLKRDVPSGEAALLLEDVEAAGQSAADLVRQLMAFARPGSLTAEPTDWNDAIGSVETILARLLTGTIHLEIQLADDPCQFLMDPSQAQQVVMNLVLNARDAIEGGGRILLHSEKQVIDGQAMAVLLVRDDGRGMDAGTSDHVFEPFFTTKGPERGTGLGLATVHAVAFDSGGNVTVDSAPGEGTTFRVAIPCLSEAKPD
jgi:two-component system sensor histidine kinase EvgS